MTLNSPHKLVYFGAAFCSLSLLAGPPVMAASTMYSSVKTINADTTIDASLSAAQAFNPNAAAASTSSTSVFNISISLEENPTGDDEYPADAGASDDAQNKFEAKIEEFADAVFQMTNGAHKLGKVTIFRNGSQANNADVRWKENCAKDKGPSAWPGGFGIAGKQIKFCTNWPGAVTLMDTPKGAGFTLAHEWGHYVYGLYDEYKSNCGKTPETKCVKWQPRSTDTASSPSIMNNQWNAARGNDDWLELSTTGVEPYATKADGDDKNGHARVYGESAWTTMARDSKTDPKHGFHEPRTQYTNVTAPTAPNLIVNDDESTARSELDIVWAGNRVVELMIDTSGSMSGTPIANAKTAANLLVDQLTPGETAIGVGRFTSSASQVFAIADIPDPDTGIKTSAKSSISSLSSGGGTNIERAAQLALSEVQAFEKGARPSVVFLLTDGRSSVNTNTIVNAYKTAGVPLITFGFGSGVDSTLLQTLASGTGGQYFFSPTTLAKIQQAFVAADAAASSNVVINSSSETNSASTSKVYPLQLDSTVGIARINVSYALNQADLSLRLLDASGSDTGLLFNCTESSEVSCTVEVDVTRQGSGQYGIEVTNNTATDKEIAILASGTPSNFENYDIAVQFDNSNYPASFTINAIVTKGVPLAGLDVTAVVTKPDGSTVTLSLLDDGKNSDLLAGDGAYTVDVPYDNTGNGNYTAVVSASNASGNAQTTYESLAISVQEDGTGILPVAEKITENFTRAAVVNASVTGANTDDHTNDPTASSSCTSIATDNIDTLGRIDSAGDVDCFRFTPSSVSDDLVIRLTSLSQNIQPLLKVFDATGQTELLKANLTTTENSESGVILTIPSASLDLSGHVVTVEHEDNTATTGNYALSIGEKLTSDKTPVTTTTNDRSGGGNNVSDNTTPTPASNGGGGAVDPWLLLMSLLLLSLLKIRQSNRS